MIYFDNAATTYPKPNNVYKKLNEYKDYGFNAGRGSYSKASDLSDLIEETRELLKEVTGLKKDYKTIFTSSATNAINIVLKGQDWKKGDIVYYSPFEHNAVLRSLYFLKKQHEIILKEIPFDNKTLKLEVENFKNEISKEVERVKFICVTHLSNVLGIELPLKNIIDIKNEYNIQLLVDGAQAAGMIDLSNLDNIDYYIFAGHKTLYGPSGIGGFLLHNNAPTPKPLIHGGTGLKSELSTMPDKIPQKLEAGSSNALSIIGLKASLSWLNDIGLSEIYDHHRNLTRDIRNIFKSFHDITVFPQKNVSDNQVGIVSVNFKNHPPTEISKILDENFNIAVRGGLHCAPETHEFLNTSPQGLVRFSLGYFNSEDELTKLKEVLNTFCI